MIGRGGGRCGEASGSLAGGPSLAAPPDRGVIGQPTPAACATMYTAAHTPTASLRRIRSARRAPQAQRNDGGRRCARIIGRIVRAGRTWRGGLQVDQVDLTETVRRTAT